MAAIALSGRCNLLATDIYQLESTHYSRSLAYMAELPMSAVHSRLIASALACQIAGQTRRVLSSMQVSQATAQAQKLAAALQTSVGATLPSTIAKTGPVTASGVQTFVKAVTAPPSVPPAAGAAAASPSGAGPPVLGCKRL